MIQKRKLIIFAFLPILLLATFLNVNWSSVSAMEDNSKAYLLLEATTGKVIIEHNSLERLPIASVTKLMTLLLTFEEIAKGKLNLEDEIQASANAAGMGGSQVFIDANASYTVENLLHAIIISSANDASVAIAEQIGDSENGFVKLMNNKAKELGCENTNYSNCTGLPSANGYSCAKDVAIIMSKVIQNPLYLEISQIWMEDFQHPSGRITNMSNTNKLIKAYTNCDAGKTGSTNEAGFCISATAQKGDMRLIAVVLGADDSKSRFLKCAELFDFGFGNYQMQCIVNKDNYKCPVEIGKASQKNVNALANESYYDLVEKGQNSKLVVNVKLNEVISAPLFKGDVVGKLIITNESIVVKEIDLIIEQDINPKRIVDGIKEILDNWTI